MPIYEYACGKCRDRFEVLVRKASQKIACPACGSKKVKRRFSTFGIGGGGSGSNGGASGSGKSSCSRGSCSGCKGCH